MKIIGFTISNTFRFLFGTLFLLILCESKLLAQISAPAASYNSTTAYSVESQDDIFVFCDGANVGSGELKAVSTDGTSGWNFTWTKWDSGTNSFSIPILVESNMSESTISSLSDGRYQVNIQKGPVEEAFQAWVFNQVQSITPTLVLDTRDCNGVFFTSSLPVHQYPDINAPTPKTLNVSTSVVFSFKRGGVELQQLTLGNYDGSSKSFVDDQAFVDEADYTMTVIDGCGFEYTSAKVFSETYVVDATFTYNPAAGEAPLEVSFETQDANATDYQWHFYQDETRIDGPVPTLDSLLTDITTGENETYTFTYLHPGKYFVKLIATNYYDGNDDSKSCVAKYTIGTPIEVKTSLFEVPNVFTPNGDDKNDVFRLKLFSVKKYNAKIFNRWGRLVYSFEESDIQYTSAGFDSDIVGSGAEFWFSVKGWNGKINGKLATPGTYFYVIEAEGREEEGMNYTKRGAVMLLHDK